MKKRIVSWLLSVVFIVGQIPAAVTALASEPEAETVSDAYISVSVSRKNGGFTVKTVEGDRLKKSDNNKKLLYHDGQYDTSFLSFRVGEGENVKEYLFGGDYPGSSDVAVTKSPAGDSIEAVWSVDGLTVTQTVALVNQEANESGMVSISVNVANGNGNAVPVKARMLLDTGLGEQDYGFYQYTNSSHDVVTVQQERVIEGENNIPVQLFASDDAYSPSVMAYSIHNAEKPYKVAFAHWNHLASTLFDFIPSTNLDFTEENNEYLTADSAYALYYDLGSIAGGSSAAMNSFYGVFSNHQTPATNTVAVNLTAPVRLDLNAEKDGFIHKINHGQADFAISVDFANIASETATDLSNVVLAVRSGSNLRSLNDQGQPVAEQDYTTTNAYTFVYQNLAVGQSIGKELYFEAKVSSEAHYERITVGVYDVSQTNGQLSETYKLGERMAYVLLPGTEDNVPKVNFAAMTPKIIYNSGVRHLFVTVANESMLDNVGIWTLKAYRENGSVAVEIPHTNINIKDGIMDVALTEDIELADGDWYLQLEWADSVVGNGEGYIVSSENAKQSGPELHFTVSPDEKYRNDRYGVLAVVEFDGEPSRPNDKKYKICTFASEEDFEKYKKDPVHYDNGKYGGKYSEIVLVFKGEFTATKKQGDVGTYYTAVSTKEMVDGKPNVKNSVLINDSLDFEDGTLNVYYEDYNKSTSAFSSAVCVEFDGSLYTNEARTSVWTGRGAFTKLEQDKANYSLAPYDENGNRISLVDDGGDKYKVGDERLFMESNEAICLMWPCVGAVGQTLSGLLFKLAYGQLGRMYKTSEGRVDDEIGTVVSFAAALDLTFASGNLEGQPPDTYWDKLQMVWYNCREGSPYLCQADFDRAFRALNWSDIEENADWTKQEARASVMVRDVIFGCGKGFVGVNFNVGVAIKNYVSGLPEIQGTIAVNTINNWSYGIEGKIDLEAFYVEAKVSFRSKDNVPVPDELYVFVSGFHPGINIDGLGVCWITGGGGGIKNLYDTIFCTQKVPPLKLMLSVSFDIIKVLECKKATLTLGLTGVSVSAQGIGIKALPGFTAIERMGLSLEWYPGIDMRANIVVNLFQGVIYGGGYLVVISPDYKDVFFEMFARAKLQVPNSIPIVGGMDVGGVDLGLNSDKIWGAVDVLFITLGVTYHWGEDGVDFSTGSKTQPTFPELLGYDEIPVGYDTETGLTLYARVGTNTQLMASNLKDNGGLVLMSNPGVILKSDGNRQNHTFNLGQRGTDNAIVQIVFDAESQEDAKTKAEAITIGSAQGRNDYGLVCYDAQQNNLSIANANLTYDETTKRATFAFTATDEAKYGKTWYMTTPADSDVLLYNVAEVPEVTSISGSVSGNDINLTWNGTNMSELDKISFYLCKNNDANETDPGYRIGAVEDSTVLASGSHTLTIPADVPSGDYYIRAVYSKTDEVNGVVFSTSKLNWTNSNMPGSVVISNAKADGDLQYELTLQQDANTDGYLVSIYNEDGTVTDFEQVSCEAAESGDTVIQVGGTYQAPDPEDNTKTITVGLKAEKKYIIGVTPYKTVSMGSGESALRGDEVKTSAIYLPKAITPTLTFSADKTAQRRVVEEPGINEGGTVVTTDVTKTVYTTNALTVTANANEAVSGTWKLNEGVATAFENTDTITIPLSELPDGEHSISIQGEAQDGDGFYTTYTFVVDTMPPQLLLSSPVNGSFFNKDGTVTLTGTCDNDARFTVTCDGETICTAQTIDTLGGTINEVGKFSMTLNLPNPNKASQRTLAVSVGDDVGNSTDPKTMTLSHGALADLKELKVMVNGQTYQNGNIPIPSTGLSDAELSLVGTMANGTPFNLTGYNVSWDVLTVDGSAEVDDSKFSAEVMSQGIITGKLAVTDTASRSATLCFGAPAGNMVAVSTTIGGSVSGGGEYSPGDTVTLTATPDSGYRFAGWSLAGVSGVDTTSAVITFTMPDGKNVTAEARFEANPIITGGGGFGTIGNGRYAQKGEMVEVTLPSGKSEAEYLPYYYGEDRTRIFAPIYAVVDGKVKFIAPKSGQYYFGANDVSFADIGGRWSESNILFAAQREIFKGTGSGIFEPEGAMDRTMLITVLYRLAGSPSISGTTSYTDVELGSWYHDAVLWGEEKGIVKGYGNGVFGVYDVITREQLCTMLTRFCDCMNYSLPPVGESEAFTDADSISDWSYEAVNHCKTRGLVNGVPGGAFAPLETCTREECCAVMERMIRSLLGAN